MSGSEMEIRKLFLRKNNLIKNYQVLDQFFHARDQLGSELHSSPAFLCEFETLEP